MNPQALRTINGENLCFDCSLIPIIFFAFKPAMSINLATNPDLEVTFLFLSLTNFERIEVRTLVTTTVTRLESACWAHKRLRWIFACLTQLSFELYIHIVVLTRKNFHTTIYVYVLCTSSCRSISEP
jgi:hypothetical protein